MMHRRHMLLAGSFLGLAGHDLAAEPRRSGHTRGHAPGDAAPSIPATDTPVGPYATAAKWAFVTDFNTGTMLLDKDADAPMAPSSMTKLMTAYLVYGQLKSGQLQLDQELPVRDDAWRTGGSKMFVPQGGKVKVEDLIKGMIIQSGNDACMVLAEGISGSEGEFVEQMNKKAKELGLNNTTYRNCTGLPDSGQLSTCRDIATLAKRIIIDFPDYYKYDNEKSFEFNHINQQNRNPLVQKGLADGLKTGHTDAGGYGLVASAQRGNRRVILVINGCTSMHQRSEESVNLLEWSFGQFENVTLFTAGDTVESARVWLGTHPSVPLVGGRDLVLTLPRSWRQTAKISVEFPSPVAAPVNRGDVLGKLSVSGQGVPPMDIPLLAGADVPRMGLPGRALAVLARYTVGGS